MSYVYIKSERAGQMGALHDLYTVGFYDPAGKWESESDHAQESDAAARVRWLNGGRDAPVSETRLSDEVTAVLSGARALLVEVEMAGDGPILRTRAGEHANAITAILARQPASEPEEPQRG